MDTAAFHDGSPGAFSRDAYAKPRRRTIPRFAGRVLAQRKAPGHSV